MSSLDTIFKMICGWCCGSGRVTEWDGVGGKWTEKCDQCKGTGKVDVYGRQNN